MHKRSPTLIRIAVWLGLASLSLACQPKDPHAPTINPAARTSEAQAMLRNKIPPLFFPFRKTFECVQQDSVVPPIDPQAEQWLQESIGLERQMRSTPTAKRNYQRVIELTRAAAQKGHWKAQMNLIHLRIEGKGEAYGLPNNQEAAVQEVEAGMKLGIPAAFDLMGYFYEHGIGVRPNISYAYAFYQRAAEMGAPEPMEFLADKLMMGPDAQPMAGNYSNVPIATKMLECSLAQGYGKAAINLSFLQIRPRTPEAILLARKSLHEGVRQGCMDCADSLAAEFEGMYLGKPECLAPEGIDKARSKRYSVIGRHLDWNGPNFKLPNLDKMLPLPPAKLPPWDGNEDHLIDAIKAVRPTPQKPVLPGHSMNGRYNIPQGHVLSMGNSLPSTVRGYVSYQQNPQVHGIARAPVSGYWQAKAHTFKNQTEVSADYLKQQTEVVSMPPAYYQEGELMEARPFYGDAELHQLIDWEFKGLPIAAEAPTDWLAQAGIVRNIDPATMPPLQAGVTLCKGNQACPQSGVWWPKVSADEKLAVLINPWWRQRYVEQGAAFPNPKDWHVDVATEKVEWRLFEVASTLNNDEAPVFVKMDNAPDDSNNSAET